MFTNSHLQMFQLLKQNNTILNAVQYWIISTACQINLVESGYKKSDQNNSDSASIYGEIRLVSTENTFSGSCLI